MILEHRGTRPTVAATAYVAPTAVVGGDVHVGPGARILFGAVLTAEDGRVDVGRNCVVMENALVRGRDGHPAWLGEDVVPGTPPEELMRRQSEFFGAHREDRECG
jgi:gamma-carbonic anhydrase